MLIGIPKEIKNNEFRVGGTPLFVQELVKNSHDVIVEKGLGKGIAISDEEYINAGAKIVDTAEEIFAKADMIIKVKEPQEKECKMLREGQILFTYLHLAADEKQTTLLQDSKCVAIAYETVTDDMHRLPLLAPMSEVAGRLSVQVGSMFLTKNLGGSGVLLAGIPSVPQGNVVIVGAGSVGSNALSIAIGLLANVTILDTNMQRLRELDAMYGNKITTLYSNKSNLESVLVNADVVVSSVLIPGASAPKIITKKMIKLMKEGSVIIDVAIDQGGSLETSAPTSHDDPVYVVDGVIHYCVTNMPGAVPKTSSQGLNNAVLPYALQIANKGYKQALKDNKHLLNGLNVHKGDITNKAVAISLNKEYKPLSM